MGYGINISNSSQITPETFGYSKIAIDTFIFSESKPVQDITLAHSLGEEPSLFIIKIDNFTIPSSSSYDTYFNEIIAIKTKVTGIKIHNGVARLANSAGEFTASLSTTNVTDTTIILNPGSYTYYWIPNTKYTLITMC